MQVFLQLKKYQEFFDMMLEEKKYSEIDNLINHMKDNRELENIFKRKIIIESDHTNILYLIQGFWNTSIKAKRSSSDLYSFNMLIEIFNLLLRENNFFFRICKKYPNILNLINLISVKYAKAINNFEKVKVIIDSVLSNFANKINKRLLCESLRNEGFINESLYYSSLLNIKLNFGNNFNLIEIDKIFSNFNISVNSENNVDKIIPNLEPKEAHRLSNSKININNSNNNISVLDFSNNNFLHNYNNTNFLKSNELSFKSVNNINFNNELSEMEKRNLDMPTKYLNNKRFLKKNSNESFEDASSSFYDYPYSSNNIFSGNPNFWSGEKFDNNINNNRDELYFIERNKEKNGFQNKLVSIEKDKLHFMTNSKSCSLLHNNHNSNINGYKNYQKKDSNKFFLKKNNFYYEYLSTIIDPIKLPTQLNFKDM